MNLAASAFWANEVIVIASRHSLHWEGEAMDPITIVLAIVGIGVGVHSHQHQHHQV